MKNVGSPTYGLKHIEDNPKVVAIISKSFFTFTVRYLYLLHYDLIRNNTQNIKVGKFFLTINAIHNVSVFLVDREGLLEQVQENLKGVHYDNFEWRMSPEEISNVFHVLAMKKYSPWRDKLNNIIIRIIEGDLLGPANHIHGVLENKNPHK